MTDDEMFRAAAGGAMAGAIQMLKPIGPKLYKLGKLSGLLTRKLINAWNSSGLHKRG